MRNSRSRPIFWLSLTAGALSTLMLGGCPIAQTPRVPADNANANTSGSSNNDTTNPDENRPIPPVVIDDDTTTSTSGNGNANGSGNNGNTNGGASGTVFVAVSQPSNSVRSRPGTIVNMTYEVVNSSGALQKTELVVARDNDNNAQADGDPVLARDITTVNGVNNLAVDTTELVPLLVGGFGRFVLGVRATTVTDEKKLAYALGSLTLDSAAPTGSWVTPTDNALVDRNQNFTVQVRTGDNAVHSLRILLDPDQAAESGNEFEFLPATTLPAGDAVRSFTANLNVFPPNTYRFFVIVSDGIAPATSFYAPNTATGGHVLISTTNRLIGTFDLNSLEDSSSGGILQGFNFNDLAGSSITRVPDLNGDGRNELLIGSRFGKPAQIENLGVGFGEAYMIYGSSQRIFGVTELNSVGDDLPGLIFAGIRTPHSANIAPPNQSTRWTKGMSDITVIPDMDGDDLPEIAFSFPRVESINLGEFDPSIQHPELFPDLSGMGNLEYTAFYGVPVPRWHPNEAQFTRGGIVIVSSHNSLLTDADVLSRRSNRVFDLHEAGQLFNGMGRPVLVPFIRRVLQRPQIDGAPFQICADCDFQQPDGWDPGDLGGPGPEDDQPGECGDDGCGFDATDPPPPTNPYTGNIHDGREARIPRWFAQWDVVFHNQAPGGFHMPWTVPSASPPLANPTAWPFTSQVFPFSFYPNVWYPNFCGSACEVTNEWVSYFPTLPCTTLGGTPSWATSGNPFQTPTDCYPNNPSGPFIVPPEEPCFPAPAEICPPPAVDVSASGAAAWTGFYGYDVPNDLDFRSQPFVLNDTGEVFVTPVGARILGQKVEDEFGTAVGSDGTWLYISAPNRTANDAPYSGDISSLEGTRSRSGIVYQVRTNASLTPGGVTRTQLWIEPGTREIPGPNPEDPPQVVNLSWPWVDLEIPDRADWTMPVPHNYIVESIGSLRGATRYTNVNESTPAWARLDREGDCPPAFNPASNGFAFVEDLDAGDGQDGLQGSPAGRCGVFEPYPVGTAGYYMDRTPQIVGPHVGSRISAVRGLGDVNDDGLLDFAVGSQFIKSNILNGTGPEVGGVFVVYGRPTGVEGDYLLEQLVLDVNDQNRLKGVALKGAAVGERLGRVFDNAGDFNGDGIDDVIVGNEGAGGNAGEAIIIFGSRTLLSPGGGWTPADAVAAGRAIRFTGASAGDLAGANVAGAGDVDGDGKGDVLIAAPGAAAGRGSVYLIYGSSTLAAESNLGGVGTVAFQGARFIGRSVGDFVGAGSKTINNTDPNGGSTTATSRGLATLGDIDGDGRSDFAISSMLADPSGRADAGEIYILYGRGD